MNINKDGKTLYFSDEEIDNNIEGEKKVFVTKRINGKESHNKSKLTQNKKQNEVLFDFSDELIIGMNSKNIDKNKRANSKNIKNSQKSNNNKKNVKATGNKRKKSSRKNKRKKNNKIIMSVMYSIFLIFIVIIFILITPIFNITMIEVDGNSKVSKETIISLSELKVGDNIFRFNKNTILKIKENSYIDSVKIKRSLPGIVKISVKEREIKYQLKVINSYIYVDKNGYILEISSEKKNVPILVGVKTVEDDLLNKKRLDDVDLYQLNNIVKIMDSSKSIEISELITEINFQDKNSYVLYIESEGKRVFLGDTTNLTNKMLYIQRMLENEKGKSGTIYVNGEIGVGFKPYFREE